MSPPRLLEVTLFVRDIDRSAAFYRAVGCDVHEWDVPEGARHFDAATRDTLVQLFPCSERHRGTHTQLGLRVVSIDTVASALDGAGIGYERDGLNRIVTADPDGNRVHVSCAITETAPL